MSYNTDNFNSTASIIINKLDACLPNGEAGLEGMEKIKP